METGWDCHMPTEAKKIKGPLEPLFGYLADDLAAAYKKIDDMEETSGWLERDLIRCSRELWEERALRVQFELQNTQLLNEARESRRIVNELIRELEETEEEMGVESIRNIQRRLSFDTNLDDERFFYE